MMRKPLLIASALAATAAAVPATASAGGPLPPYAPVGTDPYCSGSVVLGYGNGNVTANLLGYCHRNVKMAVWLESPDGTRHDYKHGTTAGFNQTATKFAGPTGTRWKACGSINGRSNCTLSWVK